MHVRAVILGGDVGGYGLARTFHEVCGTRAVVVSTVSTVPLRYSRILHNVLEPRMDDAGAVVDRLRAIAADHPGEHLILLGTSDWHVRTIVEHRHRLEDLFTVPYVPLPVLDRVTSKARFADLCRELGVGHPATVVHDVGSPAPPDVSGLRFPVIAKAADTTAYHDVDFPGKLKVHAVADEPALRRLLDQVRAAGYRGEFVVQDLVPGDDSGMRILTTYSDRDGRVRFASYGRVLLEEHTPGALGNPVGIITERNDAVVEQATRLLEHVGWTGFANFDLKFDPRTGETVFFELNPRLGRSNYYVTATGTNTARVYVDDLIRDVDPFPAGEVAQPDVPHLYHLVPLALVRRYLTSGLLRNRVADLRRSGRSTHGLWNPAESDPRRWAIVALAQANHFRKFRRHLPRPARTGVAR